MKRLVVAMGCVLGLSVVGPMSKAEADGYRLDRFRAAERPDDAFATRRMVPIEHLKLSGNIVADYAKDPLIADTTVNGKKTGERTLVSDELVLKVDLSLALWSRALLFAGFDATAFMDGESVSDATLEADNAGFGDMSLGARVRLLGDAKDLFALGVQAAAIFPTSGDSNYSGEADLALRPELILELRPKFVRVTGNIGSVLKSDKAELVFASAVGVPVHPRVELIGELHGGKFDPLPRTGNSTSLEFLAGGKVNHESGLHVGLAGGTTLLSAIGNPDFRVVGQVGFVQTTKKKEPEAPVKPVELDSDSDGLLDARDQCPREAEDRDGQSDDDGCPDLDDDADSLLDSADTCPRQAEDQDGFEDEDGCPELDNDNDAVLDADDRCPTEAEDKDGIADEDGCAETDADLDAVPDQDDLCPTEAGEVQAKGCKPVVAVSQQGEITIRDEILFEPGKDRLIASSGSTLEAVQKALTDNKAIKRVRIEGHTDNSGSRHLNRRLSQARAKSVMAWLVEHGVDKDRLIAVGCEAQYPIAANDTEDGRARNRRVVFQVTEPAPSEKERAKTPAKCVVVRATETDDARAQKKPDVTREQKPEEKPEAKGEAPASEQKPPEKSESKSEAQATDKMSGSAETP